MNIPKLPSNTNRQENVSRIVETRFSQYQNQKAKNRDYTRILREYNTPAQWYQISPQTRSIYYYDPQYQKLLQQIKKPTNTPLISRKTIVPTRLQTVPILPPIIIHKKVNNE